MSYLMTFLTCRTGLNGIMDDLESLRYSTSLIQIFWLFTTHIFFKDGIV